QFFRAVRARTILPIQHWTYDVQPALDFLASLGPTDFLPPEHLTIKTAWLLAMLGFLRPSDLERVDLSQCELTEGVLRLVVMAPKERRRRLRITKVVNIHPHSDPLLCPVLAYRTYCTKIAYTAVRKPHPTAPDIIINPLFRSLNDYLIPIGSERISKHIHTVMQHVSRPVGAPFPKARALGSTLAAASGVPVDDIVTHGNWSSRTMFEHFYRISSTTQLNITNHTLNSQPKAQDSKCNIM
ncbi:MAG: hypothetical protein EXX96DRAFT_492759, partial [Benjaminiella poitrasii]